MSGTAFFYDGSGSNHMRLSFCYPTPEDIREGVRRLSTVVNAEKEMVDMFGTASIDEAGAGEADIDASRSAMVYRCGVVP